MLLVSQNAGESWVAVCPQTWKHEEKVRKEEEARRAERERAARLQEETAKQYREDAQERRRRYSVFTCFTATKVQVLTLRSGGEGRRCRARKTTT
jgi:hypothetical protein